MELIDSHCHLDVAEFDTDRDAVIARSRANGVTGFVVPGVLASGWAGLWQLCIRVPGVYPAFGLHPVYLDEHGADDVDRLQ
ncbi:MAG: TatD family hydrolase, partial [Thiohalobacterales bacterium]|nr:TatD family hydrolase [Thiohalobacterales bacterium]